MPRTVKPIKADQGLTAEMFLDRVPRTFELPPVHGTVSATCSVCKTRMRPLSLVQPDEPTTKLSVRMWTERRWLELPNGRGTFCPRHLPQVAFWWPSFDFSVRPVSAPPTLPMFKKPEVPNEDAADRQQEGLF